MNESLSANGAWRVASPGAAPELQRFEAADLGPGEVTIDVEATGLNFADLLMMKGAYQDTPDFPLTPGLEVAGRIAALGRGISDYEIGDRVLAFTGRDGLATTLVTDAARCMPLPDSMNAVTAAGFQIAYATSHIALIRRARLAAGQRLAVLGAAGGVGLTAVEIGHALGAHVVAVARGAERLAVAGDAGANSLIDSSAAGDILAALRAEGPFDVVYDAIGGKVGEAALRAVAPEARFLLIGFASGDVTSLRANHLLVKNTDVIGVNIGAYLSFAPEALRQSLSELIRWHADGRIHPHISHTFPFERAPEALELLRSRKATGKIVVTR